METQRQYVTIRFNPWDQRGYTYHNDREHVAIGDRVVVSTDRGPQIVEVIALPTVQPTFATKPIVGKECVEIPVHETTENII